MRERGLIRLCILYASMGALFFVELQRVYYTRVYIYFDALEKCTEGACVNCAL